MLEANQLTYKLRRLRFTKSVRAEVWQLLADITQSGMPIADAFMAAASVYKIRGNTYIYHILLDFRAAIPKNELQKVVALYAPNGETLLLSNYGETDTQRLFESMARIARTELLIERAIKGAVAQPILIFALLACIIYASGSKLFPALIDTQPMDQWSITAQIFGSFTMWFASHGYVIGVVFCIFTALIAYAIPNYIGSARVHLDRMPPFSFYKLRTGASFLFSVVEAGRMGQKIDSTFLYKIAGQGSIYARDRITKIGKSLNSMSLGAATIEAQQNFPAADLNAIIAAVSNQDNWLESLGKFTDRWIEDVEIQAKQSARILNLTLVFIAAVILSVLMTSIFAIIQSRLA